MTYALRPLVAIVLALVLAFTGQSMAVARGEASARGSTILCTGAGAIMVETDASGQPVGPAHICPDGALSLIVMLPTAAAIAIWSPERSESLRIMTWNWPQPVADVVATARAPPLPV